MSQIYRQNKRAKAAPVKVLECKIYLTDKGYQTKKLMYRYGTAKLVHW